MEPLPWTRRRSALVDPQVGEIVFVSLLAVPLLITLSGLAYRSLLMAPINYNEGWNAYFASFVAAGKPLYYPPSALIANNYPPLSFVIIAPVAQLLGDALFAGRLVAWLAFCAVMATIVAIVRAIGGDRVAAALGGMVFAGYMVVNYDIYVGMDDPQMLAHAVMMLGLYIYIRHKDASWSSVVAAVTFVIGLFIKHVIIGLPLTLALWMFVYDRRAFWKFLVSGVLAAGLGLVVCVTVFGSDFVTSLEAYRPFIPQRGWRHVVEWTYPMQVPIALGLLGAVATGRDRYSILFAVYLLVALLVGYAGTGGAAVNFNIMFEEVIAFSLAAGHLIARLRAGGLYGMRAWAVGAYGVSALLGAGLVATKDVLLLRPWVAEQHAHEEAARGTVKFMVEHPGPALCLQMALCYWAHKPLELDPLNFTWGVEAGKKDQTVVLQRIESGYYATIQASARDTSLPHDVVDAIKAHYRSVEVEAGVRSYELLVRR